MNIGNKSQGKTAINAALKANLSVYTKTFAVAVCVVFAFSVLIAFYFPVYADEMLYRMMAGRYRQDGYLSIGFFPHCSLPDFALPLPFWMVPIRLVEEAIYGRDAGLLHIREIGVAIHGLSVVGMLAAIRYMDGGTVYRTLAMGAVVAVFCLGTLPFLAVMNRPDLWIRIVVILWVLLPFVLRDRPPGTPVSDAVRCIGTIILPFMIIASMHPKAVLFLPVAMVSLWFVVRGGLIRVSGIALLLALAASSLGFWTRRLACPDLPSLGNLMGQGLDPSLLLSNPLAFIKAALSNVLAFPTYWSNVLFQETHISQWIPATPGGPLQTFANSVLQATFALFLSAGLFGVVAAGVQFFKEKRFSRSAALLWALIASLAAVAAGSVPKYFIESPLMLPLLGVCAWLGVGQLPGVARRIAGGVLFTLAVTGAISSLAMTTIHYIPHALGSWTVSGYVPGQILSYNYSKYDETRADVLEAAKACDINPEQAPKHLIVDALSYPALKESFQPFSVYYLVSSWPNPQDRLLEFLKKAGSAGLVAECSMLAPSLLPFSKKIGPYCCIPEFSTLSNATSNASP